ncbi:MAG: glycosyltransferase family 2 protein, partial [Gemmatimonadaceae bacterium]
SSRCSRTAARPRADPWGGGGGGREAAGVPSRAPSSIEHAVACVIPAYNAAASVGAVARELRHSLPDGVLIVVDDGSTDGTAAAARAACDQVISLSGNQGKGAALRAGFAAALTCGARAIVTIDADGQHDPSFAPRLVAALAHADIAVGARPRVRGAMPLGRRLTNALASAAIGSIVRAPVADAQSGFRALRRCVVEQVRAAGDRYEFETAFLIRAVHAGFTLTAVEVPTIYGAPSHFRPWSDSLRVVRTIWRHRTGAPS